MTMTRHQRASTRRALDIVIAFLFGFLACTFGGWLGVVVAIPVVLAAVVHLTDKEK